MELQVPDRHRIATQIMREDRFEKFHGGPIPEDENRLFYSDWSNLQDSLPESYEESLNIKLTDLKGKKVLDMGGMMGGDFSHRAKEIGIDLVTLDPQNPYGVRSGKNVKAIMQELPFADESFDVILSHGALPYLPNYEHEYIALFTDILRVLKPRGKAVLTPLLQNIKESEEFKSMIKDMEPFADVSVEKISTENYSRNENEDTNEFYRITIIKNED